MATYDLAAAKSVAQMTAYMSDLIAPYQDMIDRSGLMVAPVCKLVWQTPGRPPSNARIQGYFEWTKIDPSTGQRNFIKTGSLGSTLRNPLGAGALNYRYSISDDPDRTGNNWVVQSTTKKVGFGVEKSNTMGEALSAWKHESIGIAMGDELFRIDYVHSLMRLFPWLRSYQVLRALPAFEGAVPGIDFDVKCGGDLVIYSPALKHIPGYSNIGQLINGLGKLKHRIIHNREHYEHEPTFSDAMSTMFRKPEVPTETFGMNAP